jgi:outer membrane lipoprotein SlyB
MGCSSVTPSVFQADSGDYAAGYAVGYTDGFAAGSVGGGTDSSFATVANMVFGTMEAGPFEGQTSEGPLAMGPESGPFDGFDTATVFV